MAQIVFENSQILWLLPLLWFLLVIFAWKRRFKPFGPFLMRLFMVVLLVLALAQPRLAPPASEIVDASAERLVVLVDQSASLGEAGQQALRVEAARLAQGLDKAIVLFFADQAVWSNDALTSPTANVSAARLNSNQTNLAAALRMGGELLMTDELPGRLLLLSDGIPTTGDALEAASQLARQNIPVDVVITDANAWGNSQNEVRVVSMDAPPVLRQGEPFNIEVMIHSEQAMPEATLTLTHPAGQEVLAEDTISLEPGPNLFTFSAVADTVGPRTYQAIITAAADRFAENNSLGVFTQVYPAPKILVVADEPALADNFAVQLQEAGYETTITRPADLSDRLSALEGYDGMVLLDVSAKSLALEQMIAIEEFVRSLGRGLVLTAGRNSFALGGYDGTPLANLLPVTLEPPPREERPPVALLLVIDHSGSMVEDRGDLPTALALAKEAAIRATDILGLEDYIGVMMFDNKFDWIVPFQQIENGVELLKIQQRLARIPGGGGTRILQALEIAIPAFIEQQQTATARHIVLLSDGKSFDGDKTLEDYDKLVDAAREANITLSAIAITNEADTELMAHLAERGRGRYHFAHTPDELPALTISESDILRSQALQEGDFKAAIYAPHPIVRGIFLPLPAPNRREAPALSGYLAMTPKPEAEVALQVGPGDPLLSVWGYGLGRVAVWSSDTGKEWTTAWRNWPDFNPFVSQIVGYTLPAPDLGLLQVETGFESDGVVVLTAAGVTAAAFPVERARTVSTVTQPGGQQNQFRLQQVAPGRYERRLRLPAGAVYQSAVTQARGDEPDETTISGFVVPYPAEYDVPANGAGASLLTQIAALTGGQTFKFGQFPGVSDAASPKVSTLTTKPVDVWPWLLLAALVLWPLEIAWRRWGRLRIQ